METSVHLVPRSCCHILTACSERQSSLKKIWFKFTLHCALQQGVNLIPRDDNSTVDTDNFTLQVRKEREKCKNAPNILHGIPPLKIYGVICKKYNLFSKKKCRTKAHHTERQLNSKPSVCTMMHDAMVGKCHSDNLYEQSLLCSVCLRFYFSSYNLI